MSLPDAFPTFHIYIAFLVDPTESFGRFDLSVFDTALFADTDQGFVEVTDRLDPNIGEPVHIVGGRESPLQDYDSRTCTVAFRNDDGRFDALNLAGEYVTAGESEVKLGRRLMVAVELADGTLEPRFAGQIESYTPGLSEFGWPTMRIVAKGLFALLARTNPDASSPTGEGEDTGARQDRLADIAGIADADRNFSTGDRTVQATTAAQNLLTEMRLAAATESPLGGFYEARDGRLTHDNATKVLTATRSKAPRVTLGPPGAADTLPYTELVPAFDKKQLVNDDSIAAVGGEAHTAEDSASITAYYRYQTKRTDLLYDNDEDAAARVLDDLYFFSEPRYRYESVSVDCCATSNDTDAADLIDFMATSELRDRVAVLEQITYRDPDTDVAYVRENTEECLVERVEEWIGHASWRQTFQLFSARAISNVAYFDVSLFDGSDLFAPL